MFVPAASPHPEQQCPATPPHTLMSPGQKSALVLSHRRGATAESKTTIVKENEAHDGKVWGICCTGAKGIFHGENGGEKP